jgi:uncharacterized repeat protein (TIGR01451 family)
MRSFAASALAITFAFALPAVASAKPAVTLKLSGSLVTKASDGHTVLSPVDKAALHPGDEVEYDIAAVNVGTSPAFKLAPVARIPAGTSYIDGSARAPRAHAEFSLDQGKTWSSAPTIAVKNADGTTSVKKAPASLYTAIRFVSDGALAPRGSTDFAYEVRVK